MKVSFYNIFIENKKYNNWLLFNTKSCSLLEIDEDIKNYLENEAKHPDQTISKKSITCDVKNELIDYGILINCNTDELQEVIEEDKKAYEFIRNSDNFIDLTICPTLKCNLKCTYCYEVYHSDSINYGVMNESVQQKIIEVYANHCERNKIQKEREQKITDSITWYGGEPLICKNVINTVQNKINNLAKKYNRKLRNSITTNGILLTTESQNILRENEIRDIQISIDGPKEIHNKRRYFPKSPSRSFDIIVDNLNSLDEYFKVLIRINVDKGNYSYVNQLIDELVAHKIWPKKNVSIDIGNVKCYQNNNLEYAVSHDKFEQISRAFRIHKLTIYNQSYKDKKARLRLLLPTLTKNGCRIAVNRNANVIGPKGEIYSCWSNVGNNKYVIGSIDDMICGNDFNIKSNSAITPELRKKIGCYSCKIFPICSIICQESLIRGEAIHHTFLCSKWKSVLSESLLFNYDFEHKHPELSKRIRA